MPTLRIKLGNRLVGTITNVVTDKNIFVFDPGYVEDERRPVLSLSYYDMERRLITRPREVQRRLPPFFSNLLPERDGVLRDYLAQRGGISPEREFPLLWLVGADLPGAVIAEDSEGQPLPPEEKTETRKTNKEEVLRFSRRHSTKILRDRPGRKATSHSSPGARRPVDRKTAVAKILQGAGKRIRDDDAGQGSGNRCAGIRAHTGRLDR